MMRFGLQRARSSADVPVVGGVLPRRSRRHSAAESPATPGRRQRILCLTSNFPRWLGDSTTPFVLHLAEDLQKLGWQVDVLAPHAPGAAVHELIGGVRVQRFRYLWPERMQTVCYQGGALINLRTRPQEWLKLPALLAAQWLTTRRLLAQGDYDLLHTHWLLPQGYIGTRVAARRRLPHVITVHGGDVFALRGRLLRHFKRAALEGADRVTANSSVTERAVRSLAPDGCHVARIPMGISLDAPARSSEQVQAVRQRHRCGDGPLLICVGRLVEEKGIGDMLQAVALLIAERPEVQALIIGEGQDRDTFQQQAHTLGIADRVHFSGWIQNHEVAAYIAAADVFINPSRRASNGWVEAQGLAILEAMAAGTPVIATAQGGVVDAVLHEETGLLVAHLAPAQIAAAVLRLLREPDLAARIAAIAQARVRRRFSRESSARAFSRLFDDLLSDPARP